MTQQVLKPEYKKAIKDDPVLWGLIAGVNNKKNSTVETWLRTDDVRLTTAATLNVIRQHLSLPVEEILTEAKESEAQDNPLPEKVQS